MVRLNWMSAASTIVSTAVPRGPSANPADGPYELLESAGPAEITLLRSGNLALAVTVDYATTTAGTAGPGDFSPVAGTLTFAPGAASARFFVIDDRVTDGTKTIGLALTNPSGGAVILGAPTATIVITDAAPGYTFTEIATTSDDGFSSLALPRINDAGVVAYAGTLADGTMEIRTSDASIMLANDPSAAIFPDIAFNNAGHLAFGGTLTDGRRGVFRVSPTTVSIVALSGSASGEFRSFGSPSLNDTAIWSSPPKSSAASACSSRPRVTAWSRWPTPAAIPSRLSRRSRRSTTPGWCSSDVPPDGDARRVQGRRRARRGGQRLVAGCGLPGAALQPQRARPGLGHRPGHHGRPAGVDPRRPEGALVTTATTESGAYANLSQGDNSPAFSNAGMVAFWAGLPAGHPGSSPGPIPAAGKVLQTGDPLFGSTVVETSLGGLNNRGEITFRARLSNGRQVIGVATPPRP